MQGRRKNGIERADQQEAREERRERRGKMKGRWKEETAFHSITDWERARGGMGILKGTSRVPSGSCEGANNSMPE